MAMLADRGLRGDGPSSDSRPPEGAQSEAAPLQSSSQSEDLTFESGHMSLMAEHRARAARRVEGGIGGASDDSGESQDEAPQKDVAKASGISEMTEGSAQSPEDLRERRSVFQPFVVVKDVAELLPLGTSLRLTVQLGTSTRTSFRLSSGSSAVVAGTSPAFKRNQFNDFRISGIPGSSISVFIVFVACNPLSFFSFFVTPRLRPGDSPGDSPSDAPVEVPGDSTGCAPAAVPSWDFTFLMSFTSLLPPGVIDHFSSLHFGLCPRVNHVALNNVHCRSGMRLSIRCSVTIAPLPCVIIISSLDWALFRSTTTQRSQLP